MANSKHIILVLSGKGGVGKSTVAAMLAVALSQSHKVGLLDIDLCGPSIPKLLGLETQVVHQSSQGWIPVYTSAKKNLAVMSIGFLLSDKNDAVVWRGPKKTAMIKQFLTDVVWEDLDFLIIDTPPGTSDEHIAIVEAVQSFKPDGAVLVTTPQNVSIGDVRREVTFCKKAKLNIVGIIENMSGFVCPHCTECSNLFSSGGGLELSKLTAVPFLGHLPLDPKLTAALEIGNPFDYFAEVNETAKLFERIVTNLCDQIASNNESHQAEN